MTQPTLNGSEIRYHAPYMEWAKTRPPVQFDLAGSNILACSLDDLPGARDAVAFSGANENGYPPLMEAIAARYGADASQVTTASGASGANFLVYAALLSTGDEVLVERPGYDPLLGAARMFGANTIRVDRPFDSGFALDPDRVRHAITPRTKLIVVTHPHNPTGVVCDRAAWHEIGLVAEQYGAHVLVDEVYLDVSPVSSSRTATRPDVFLTTSSLTKSYGLSSLRCGWVIAPDALTYRLRRARDVIDGTGSIVAERLGTLAFQHLERLETRARQILRTNARMVDEFLASRPDLEWVPSVGTVVFPRIRGVSDASAFAERLMTERHTAVAPGRFFDAPEHFRLGYGGDTGKLRGGLERLAAALDAKGC
jgi:aspartate/methionine/tyrosine aminotransferase